MALDVRRGDLTVGVAGCGIMGRGIAQVAAAAGCRVILLDGREGVAAQSQSLIADTFAKLAARGKMPEGKAGEAAANLRVAEGIADLAECQVVIEAIFEDLSAKRSLMRQLEEVVDIDCVLATNTSSLSVTAIAAACRYPGRVAGFHFFNPVPLMKVVEVVNGALTEERALEALIACAELFGHKPVRAKDTPGFIVNHAGRGYVTEALRLLGEGVAPEPVIDEILKGAAGFRMGPFELLDLTGLDVSQPVMESIYNQYYQEPRFRPSPLARLRLEAGLLGRKSGRGFYDYIDGQKSPKASGQMTGNIPVTAFVAEGAAQSEIIAIIEAAGCKLAAASGADLCIVPLLGEDTSTAVMQARLDPQRSVGIDALFGLRSYRTIVATPATALDRQASAHALFSSDGVAASVIKDSPGAVVQRVVAMIINIACDIAQQRIASPSDIDAAVVLGLAYPKGPLAWGDEIGATNVLSILEALQRITGDPRYRPSLWLRRRAQLGLSLLHSDC